MSEFATEYYWEVREIIGTKKQFPDIHKRYRTMEFDLEECADCGCWKDVDSDCDSDECWEEE